MIRNMRPESVTYQIQEFLGEGSMAFVYKALRVDSRGFSRQPVALKILKSEKQVQILVQEMETLMKIRSSHCVSLLGWENMPEGPAIVMEWVEGISLETLARAGPVDPALGLEIAAQVQNGLKDLLVSGLCHGDLSPSNILIDECGHVRLVDFGLSGTLQKEQISGTPQFMAPERWKGNRPTLQSDLFSLGQIIFDLEAGQLTRSEPVAYWRHRVQNAGTGWRALEPSARTFAAIESVPERKKRLGERVRQVRASMKATARTLLNERTSELRRNSFKGAWALVAILIFLFPIRPYGESARFQSKPSSALEVRTLSWVHLQLGLLDLGYAPLAQNHLPPGLHRLVWRTQKARGVKIISLGYGERKILRDSDFR